MQAKDAEKTTPPHSIPADTPVQPAAITLKNGALTVHAHNSSLDQILKEVAHLGGMTLDGNAGNERIFGSYGPGDPRDVLTSLLTGSGYNFVMTGNMPDGVPRTLLLSAAPATTSGTPAIVSKNAENPAPGDQDTDTLEEEPPGPGAIIHVPPAGPDDPQDRARQNLQRLTHMREQQNKTPQQ